MITQRWRRAFSLVEVILAVGIFAAAVVVVLAMLPALTRQSVETEDSLTAQRLPESVRVELRRIAATAGFEPLAAAIQSMSAPMPATLTLVASRDGARLHAETLLPPATGEQLLDGERYFLIEAWRFSSGELAYDQRGTTLPVYVRVSWPYRLPNSSAPTAASQRNQLDFTVTINR